MSRILLLSFIIVTLAVTSVAIAQSTIFKGTLTIVISGGSGLCAGTRSFQESSQLTIGPPAQTPSGLQDVNPNILILQSDNGSSGGAFSLYTALATTDGALFQYWVYTITERSDRSQFDLSGEMVYAGNSEGVVLNAFVVEEPIIPYQCTGTMIPNYTPIAIGATFAAGISQTQAKFVVTSTSIDLTHTFEATFDGTYASGALIQLR